MAYVNKVEIMLIKLKIKCFVSLMAYVNKLEIMLIKLKFKCFLSLMAYVNKVASLCATSPHRKTSFRIHHSHHLTIIISSQNPHHHLFQSFIR